jgi:hypothetical protein
MHKLYISVNGAVTGILKGSLKQQTRAEDNLPAEKF